MASCRSCGAQIGWATDIGGKPVPVDPGEREDGTLAVQEAGGKLHARYLRKDGAVTAGERRTVSHFATCPQAGEWRTQGGGHG